MSSVVDTSILIDVLRGDGRALDVLDRCISEGVAHSSEIVRLEVLAGMRPDEESPTRALLDLFEWHPVDERIAELAGELARSYLRGIDSADLAIAATASALGAALLTRNVKHFPMFPDLTAPY